MDKSLVNKKILEKLEEFFKENPDEDFWRGLYNCNIIRGFRRHDKSLEIVDDQSMESEKTLKNMNYFSNEDYI